MIKNLHTPSFGYHCSGGSSAINGSQGSILHPSKLTQFADAMRKTAFIAVVTLGIAAAIGIASFTSFFVAASGFVSSSVFYYSSEYFSYKEICETAGIVFENAEQVKHFEVAGINGRCEAIPTEHCADTEVWRADLIRAAEHNIVLSGNYCGGTSFAKLLALIEKKIKANPNFKVVILSSPNFIKNGNLTKIQTFSKIYPHNFSLIESPDIWHVSTGLKKSTNHTKCLVIDYGKYFILGGSGVKDNFAETGLDNLTKEDFLKQKKAEWAVATENSKRKSLTQKATIQKPVEEIPTDINEKSTVDPNAEDGFFSGHMIPGNFRDMDFVFRCQGGKSPSGKQVYKQMLLLCYRWEQYNKMLIDNLDINKLNVNNLAVFTGEPSTINPNDSVLVELLKTPIPKWENIKTRVPHFEQSAKKTSHVSFQIFASGPEHKSSQFAELLEKKIRKSKNQIVINHMYFHPTPSITKALAKAAERGVKIKIITTGIYKDCPNSHYVFGSRNKANYSNLVRSISKENRANVEVYEYQQKKKGNHKKVILIDNNVIAGSSNLGYKSLVTTSDHELNFFANSKEFANETMKICNIDINHSQKIADPTQLTAKEYIEAAMHRVMAPLIG